MREWLTVIIVLLILGILLDGWRRMRQSRRDSIKMSLSMHTGAEKEELESYGSELPNGGARVVSHRDEEKARDVTRNVQGEFEQSRGQPQTNKPEIKPVSKPAIEEQVGFDLGDEVPMLMESVTESSAELDELGISTVRKEPRITAEPLDSDLASSFVPDMSKPVMPTEENLTVAERVVPERVVPEKVEVAQQQKNPPRPATKAAPKQSVKPEASRGLEAAPETQEVLVINVMAPKGQHFQGAALLEMLLETGMRYGDMDIFHRYIDENGDGAVLFSMANMVMPGTFDLNNMAQFSTPGVSLFLTLPLASDSLEAFNIMASTAKHLVDHLGGELKDEQRSVMTNQTLEHCRQRIREFERKRLL